jgi:hypothetical protein
MANESNILVIAVDPGFDATKVVINGVCIKIPYNVVNITNDTQKILFTRTDDFILSHYIRGGSYLVGEEARKLMMQKEERQEQLKKQGMMDSFNKFETQDFNINFFTALGIALIRYSRFTVRTNAKPALHLLPYVAGPTDSDENKRIAAGNKEELSKFKIILGVALPHEVAVNADDPTWPAIHAELAKPHEFSVEVKEGEYPLSISVPEKQAKCLSQVICALLGEAADDTGNEIKDSEMLKYLPALVIDGGYKTVGLFKLTTIKAVAQDESNTDYAMGNIHKAVAQELRDKYGRSDIQDFSIPSILEDPYTAGKLVYQKDQNTAVVDVSALCRATEETMFNAFINYIDDKFEKLLDIKQILITGGTGAVYYPYFKKYAEEHAGHLVGHVILTDYDFFGKKLNPVYAIAAGLYKTLRHSINLSQAHETAAN